MEVSFASRFLVFLPALPHPFSSRVVPPPPPNSDPSSKISPRALYISQSMSNSDTPFTILTTEPAKNPNVGRHDALAREDGAESPAAERPMTPSLSHRLKYDKSILALAVSKRCIFAGTEDGEILACFSVGLDGFRC
jgi:hypothetical protein